MTLKKTVFNAATGETTDVDFTPQEEAAHVAAQADDAARRAADAVVETRVSTAKPPPGLLVKLRDNVALTAPELQAVVRYLALQAIREARS